MFGELFCKIFKNTFFYRTPLLVASKRFIKEHQKHIIDVSYGSNKKSNIPISGMSLGQIYTLLDAIDSKGKENIENLKNDSDRIY